MINNQPTDSLETLLHRMINRIRQSLELSVILSSTVAEVRAFLHTDRVKIYQFDTDGSGEVVAESVDLEKLPSLLGQRFPAQDIPLQMRELYLQERQRTIVNIASRQIGMSSSAKRNVEIEFREVDPCHAEYLIAMGTQSSLVVPIIDNNRLWGLLVSHHSMPRIVTKNELEIVQLVADQTSIAIAQSNLLESTRIQAQQEASINRVGKSLHSMTEMQPQQALKQTISALQGAGGRLYLAPFYSEQTQLYISGEQPVLALEEPQIPIEEYSGWQTWLENNLQTNNVVQPWATAEFAVHPKGHKRPRVPRDTASHIGERRLPSNGGKGTLKDSHRIARTKTNSTLPSDLKACFEPTKIKGILTIRLEYHQKTLGYLSIFRRGIDVETIWARRTDRDDPRNIFPRQSFETWRQLQQNKARPWANSEIELAQILGRHFAIAIYQYQLYQQVSSLNTSLEQRVIERTVELEQTNQKLVREINNRLKTRADLERLSHQNELILNSAGEGIYGLNLEGITTFVNPAAAEMLGYQIDELTNQPMYEITNHSTAEGNVYSWPENPIYQTLQTGVVNYATNEIFWRKDSSSFPVEYVCTPIKEKEQIVGAVVIFKDITERQIIDRMKDEFISVVSHELRTPLTSIRSSISLLTSGHIDPQSGKNQRLLEIALDNSNRLVRLINDILDLERIKSGKVTMYKQSYNAANIMMDAVAIVQNMADKADITISVNPLTVQLWVDRDRIIQALTNLLSNAIKFSSPNTTVSLAADLQGEGMVVFQVKDRGRGIPSEHLETIFHRFQQVDASDSRDRGGTGLGLAICRSIIQQHDGQIWVESTLGQGSAFYFTLPMNEK